MKINYDLRTKWLLYYGENNWRVRLFDWITRGH